jgi:putative transposase
LRVWIEYFGAKFGKTTVAVPPHYTSIDCSSCGTKVQKSLSTRTHRCHCCNVEICRDVNAAINILQKGLRTAGHAGTWAEYEDMSSEETSDAMNVRSVLNAWGELTSTLVGATLLEQVGSPNQESHG